MSKSIFVVCAVSSVSPSRFLHRELSPLMVLNWFGSNLMMTENQWLLGFQTRWVHMIDEACILQTLPLFSAHGFYFVLVTNLDYLSWFPLKEHQQQPGFFRQHNYISLISSSFFVILIFIINYINWNMHIIQRTKQNITVLTVYCWELCSLYWLYKEHNSLGSIFFTFELGLGLFAYSLTNRKLGFERGEIPVSVIYRRAVSYFKLTFYCSQIGYYIH